MVEINRAVYLERIEKALNQIRPYLEADGGNVKVLDLSDDLVLKLEMVGACGACSMSPMTLKGGIEHTIKREVPEIREIIAVNVPESVF